MENIYSTTFTPTQFVGYDKDSISHFITNVSNPSLRV